MFEVFARIVTAIEDPSGQCYAASEALYHALGGKRAGWVPMVIRWQGRGPQVKRTGLHSHTHWYLRNRNTGVLLDPTVAQFVSHPDYRGGHGCGFLTKKPSERARLILRKAGLSWT